MRSALVPIVSEGCPSVWHMSDQQTKSVLKVPIGDLVKAGPLRFSSAKLPSVGDRSCRPRPQAIDAQRTSTSRSTSIG